MKHYWAIVNSGCQAVRSTIFDMLRDPAFLARLRIPQGRPDKKLEGVAFNGTEASGFQH